MRLSALGIRPLAGLALALVVTVVVLLVLERRESGDGPPGPAPTAARVVSVTDGDTLVLAGGQPVRLVGIDAPERGACGSDRATELLSRLTLDRRVELSAPVDDRDRYDRLLRYVDVGDLDAGYELIAAGLAVPRYDSRDGYDRHPRQDRYVAEARAVADRGDLVCREQ